MTAEATLSLREALSCFTPNKVRSFTLGDLEDALARSETTLKLTIERGSQVEATRSCGAEHRITPELDTLILEISDPLSVEPVPGGTAFTGMSNDGQMYRIVASECPDESSYQLLN